MIEGKTVLAVIPARSGSKRCPGKNFLPYKGKTLVEWAMEAATGSKYLDRIVLSKDEDRPPELCTDTATCEDVLRYHHRDEYWCVLLQPTSPNRTSEDIDRTIEKSVSNGYGAISTFHYKTNGAEYVASREWLEEHDFGHSGLAKYEMPEERSLDINEPEDFQIWDEWNSDGVYFCDTCLKELENKDNRLTCSKCRKFWLTDPIKGVLRHES